LLRIGKEFANEMIAHALEDDPNECCGILSGADGNVAKLYRITNSSASPVRYQMDPKEHFEADRDSERSGMDVLAFYHSHTHSPAYPSQTDVRLALESGYLKENYVLVSLEHREAPQIRAFHITESGEIVEDQLELG
jgi:proteasome lid subunit RPN8/RPN11